MRMPAQRPPSTNRLNSPTISVDHNIGGCENTKETRMEVAMLVEMDTPKSKTVSTTAGTASMRYGAMVMDSQPLTEWWCVKRKKKDRVVQRFIQVAGWICGAANSCCSSCTDRPRPRFSILIVSRPFLEITGASSPQLESGAENRGGSPRTRMFMMGSGNMRIVPTILSTEMMPKRYCGERQLPSLSIM